MAIAPLPNAETIDPVTGKARPLSDEERKVRSAALQAALLAETDQITDKRDTDEVWAEVYRNIDECRPHRPLFKGRY